MKTPRQAIEILRNKYKTQLLSLGITFAIGLLMHLYVMTNKFFNFFEMNNILASMSYAQGDTLQLGRWFLPVASNLFTSFSIPAVNGIFLMAYLSIAAFLICELLCIESVGYRILTGLAIVSFPGVSSVLAYGVNSDAFGFSLCMAVLSVYLTAKYKYGIFPGIIALVCSLGVYQPYFALAIGVVYCLLFAEVTGTDFKAQGFLKKVFRYLLLLGAGFILYYVILQGALMVTGTDLSDYHGVDSMTSFTLKGIAKGFVYSYGYFFSYFFTTAYVQNIVAVAAHIILAVLFVGISIMAVRSHAKREEGQMFFFAVLLCLLPLGVNASPFLMADRVGSGVDIYTLFSLMFVFFLLFQAAEKREAVIRPLTQWIAVLGIVVLLGNGYLINNQVYHRMEAMAVTTTTLLNRVAARMENHPEWTPEMPVYLVNAKRLVNANYEVEIPWYDEMENIAGTEFKPSYNERAIRNYMKVYLHFPVELATEQEKAAVEAAIDVDSIAIFPAAESLQVVDGIMIVKLNQKE